MKKLCMSILVLSTAIYSCNNASYKAENAPAEEVSLSEYTESDQMVQDTDNKKLIDPVSMKGMKGTNNTAPIAENKNTTTQQHQNKIIRKGNLAIESKDITNTKSLLDNLISKAGGYYEQESTSAGSTYTNLNLKVRIPSNNFDEFINSIEKGQDKITNKSITAEDVTLKYYDLESRIKSKRAYLEQYLKMVSSAKSVSDLLQIQEQIRQLQEDIDSTEALLKTLSNQVSYSTITIDVYHNDSLGNAYTISFFSEIKDAFVYGWELIKSLCIGFIRMWPILIIVLMAFFGWKRFRKKKF